MQDGHLATAIALVDIDDIDANVNPNDSLFHMDSKLIDDRAACIDAIDDGNRAFLMRLLAMDKEYLNAEHAEARPVEVNLLG